MSNFLVSECPHPPTDSPILLMLTCKLELKHFVFNHASVFKPKLTIDFFWYFLNDTVTSVSVKVCCILMEDSFKIKGKFFKTFCNVRPLYLVPQIDTKRLKEYLKDSKKTPKLLKYLHFHLTFP